MLARFLYLRRVQQHDSDEVIVEDVEMEEEEQNDDVQKLLSESVAKMGKI